MAEEAISIRSIQHFLYCPHRWGLIEIDRAWAENAFVTKANLIHERVHDPDLHYSAKGKKVFASVAVYNDAEQYNLYGVLDCLELPENEKGLYAEAPDRKPKLSIVEYKPRKPAGRDFNEDDFMQVFAQKLCADYTFNADCDGYLYYADVKRRVKLPLRENFAKYDILIKALLEKMRTFLKAGKIPPVKKGQKCSGCSMKDLCMPRATGKLDIRAEIMRLAKS